MALCRYALVVWGEWVCLTDASGERIKASCQREERGELTLDIAAHHDLKVAHRVVVLELAVDDVGPDLELAVLVRAKPGAGVDAVLQVRVRLAPASRAFGSYAPR